MEKQVTNAIRGVMMNDLGLSRELIREEALKLIEQTVEKRFNRLIEGGELTQLMIKAIRAVYDDRPPMTGLSFRGTMEKALYDAAREAVRESVEIQVKEGA